MQWIVLVLSSLALVTARPRSGTSHNFALQPYQPRSIGFAALQSYQPRSIGFAKQHNEVLWHPRYQEDLFEILKQLDAKRDLGQPKMTRKRALSALSRFKPLIDGNTKEKPPTKIPSRAPMISMLPDINLLSSESAETFRGMGTPLRWGRKR